MSRICATATDLAIFLAAAAAAPSRIPPAVLASKGGRRLARLVGDLGAEYLSGNVPPLDHVIKALELVQRYGVRRSPQLLTLLPAPERVATRDDVSAIVKIRFPEAAGFSVLCRGAGNRSWRPGFYIPGDLPEHVPDGGWDIIVFVHVHRVKDWRRRLRELRRELSRKVPASVRPVVQAWSAANVRKSF